MKNKLFSIQDAVANTFAAPFSQLSEKVALRSFSNAVNDPSTTIYRNPADYNLWHVGEFDDETGVITSSAATLVANGANYKE